MKYILTLSFILLIQNVQSYFEQKIIRRAFNYDPDLSYINIEKFVFDKCPEELLLLKHNSTYVTQVCFQKDLFYNVELILGDKQAVEFSLDLTSPWTWFKSEKCKKCLSFDPTDFDNKKTCKNPKKSNCSNGQFNATYDSPDWQDNVKTAKMYSNNELVLGKFQSDKLSFLAYNSSRMVSLGEFIAEQLGTHEVLDNVTIYNIRMMNVLQIQGAQNYLSDGSLGLGFGFAETDDDGSEPDTDFLEKLIKQESTLKLTRQRFSIYCLEKGPYFKDYVVQFGGFDVKYAHEHTSDIVWLQRVPNSGYYWMAELNSIHLQNFGEIEINKTQVVTKNRAIFSLSSQFIELPKEELLYFMDKMNSFGKKTNCSLVDEKDLLVYCRHLEFPIHLTSLKMIFTFEDDKKFDLSSHLLYRNCTQDDPDIQYIQSCIMNVRYSKSGYVILGEPFMKWHYTIFDNEPGNNLAQIGLLPAATNMYYEEYSVPIFDPSNWYLYKAVMYIFVFGIVFMCCAVNCRRAMKDCNRAFRQRKNLSPDDQKKLRVKQIDEEMNQDTEYDQKMQEFSMQQKKKEEWEDSNKQFNFQMRFDKNSAQTQSIEDSSI